MGAGMQLREKSTLAYDELVVEGNGTGEMKTAMVVHGLMGSGRNWRTFSKRLATGMLNSTPGSAGWRMVLIDLRNHGNSANLPILRPPHNISAAARDVADLIKSESWDAPDAMIAHSLGGKVVLEFAQKAAMGSYGVVNPPKQLWILDSVPGEVPTQNSDGEVERVLAILKGLPKPIPSRRWLADYFVEKGFSKGLADWLGSNLKRVSSTTEEMDWVFNVDGAYDMFSSYKKADYWSVLDHPPVGTHINIVRAAKSDRWTPDIIARLKEAEAKKIRPCLFSFTRECRTLASHRQPKWVDCHHGAYPGEDLSKVALNTAKCLELKV